SRKLISSRICEGANSRRGKLAKNSHPSNFNRHMRDTHPDECLSAAQRDEKFGDLLANAVAVNMVPFNVVDSKEFKEIFNFLNPDVKVPSRRTIATKERNVKKIAVKPLNTLDEYSSDDLAELEDMTQSEDSEEELEMMINAVKKEIEAERQAEQEVTKTSRSKRGRSPTTSSSKTK
ncbi:hypothetical protein PENTCL1PPCAC_20390, partial [Pristionchus entomophagus]